MIELPHPKQLFDLLALYGATHAQIAQDLGVSVYLVDSWSISRRKIPLDCYNALLTLAVKQANTVMQAEPLPTAPDRATCDRLLTYLHALRAAYTEQGELAREMAHHISQRFLVQWEYVKHSPSHEWTADTIAKLREWNGMLTEYLTGIEAQDLIPQGEHLKMVGACQTLIGFVEAYRVEKTQGERTEGTCGQREHTSDAKVDDSLATAG